MEELYYEDKYAKEIETTARVTIGDEDVAYLKFEENIFYPQGGGQKGDRGKVVLNKKETCNVVNTIKDSQLGGAISIVDEKLLEELDSVKVECFLDWPFRYAQMKLHTVVHAHHCVMEEVIGEEIAFPKVSSIEDGFAFNKYSAESFDFAKLGKVNEEFQKHLKAGAEVKTYAEKGMDFRWWECMGHKIPCGGIHVDNLTEVGDVDITFSNKKGNITVKFALII
ncbi:serine-tRNA(Ala) deacylase AlaX [Clostridia bacterium]|nr:serine-tRNA(Ala) deacylase AlaX [Clostridia bacterium]